MTMISYEDLIDAINSTGYENDHEKLVYIVYELGKYFHKVDIGNWIKVLDMEKGMRDTWEQLFSLKEKMEVKQNEI